MNSSDSKIWTYLSKFNQNQKQISQKLNPFLRKIRQNHINSFLQLNNLDIQNSDLSDFIIQKQKNNVFKDKISINQNKQNNSLQFFNDNKTFDFKNNQQNYFRSSQITDKIRKSNKRSSLSQSRKINLFSESKVKYSELRTMTANNKNNNNKKSYSTLIPKTADATLINLNLSNKFIKNPQRVFEFQQNPQDDIIKFKMLAKNPHFGSNKASKIKSHLVADINFEQIQKNFYQSPQNITNYKKFYEKTLKKYSEILYDGKKQIRINKFNKNSRNLFFIKEQPQKCQINQSKQINKQSIDNKSSQQYQVHSPINHRKISVRTRFCQKKQSSNDVKNLLSFKSNLSKKNQIQVKGKSKNLTGQNFKSLVQIN